MKPDQPSRTAEITAAVRAWHYQQSDPAVFSDSFAHLLASPFWRFVSQSRLASWLVFEGLLQTLQPVAAHILGRARYVEDRLSVLRERGLNQYVLVGAGLDSISLRNPGEATPLRIFEIDHPASQRAKRRRLQQVREPLPEALELIPVDFERESLTDSLRRSSFDPSQPALFAWLGVAQYLSEEAVFETLQAIHEGGAPGSELIFDYIASRDTIPEDSIPLLEALARFTERRGEPLKATFDPEDLPGKLSCLGFEVAEDLSPQEQGDLYFGAYSEGFRPPGFYHLVRVGWAEPAGAT